MDNTFGAVGILTDMSRSLVEILRTAVGQLHRVPQDSTVNLEELQRSILDIAEVLETPTLTERRRVRSVFPPTPSLT